MSYYVTHLESAIDGTHFPPDQLHTTHSGRPLWVRYDLEAVRRSVDRDQLIRRPSGLWRYRELLPLPPGHEPVTLGETITPLLPAGELGRLCGVQNLWIKDESRLPGGTFKSRGMTLAISMARRFGVKRVALPTAGNAGGAAALYAAAAGMEAFVFMPDDTPAVNQYEAALAGARVYRVRGLISDCGNIVRSLQHETGWLDLSTLREPYRLEGKKTMGLELAEQFQWRLPDVILYPTGGGTGLIGMWKAFQELSTLGWLNSEKLPRMVAVQSDGCCPIVRAFQRGERFAQPFPNAHTIASGIRVPSAVGDFMMLDTLRASQGTAVAVPEASIPDWMRIATRLTGIPICPEAAACVGALQKLAAEGWIHPEEHVVLFNTATALKYVETIQTPIPEWKGKLER
ncbi:MAG: threonine synthase [Pirellulaceae bacterium]|nr:MAG: threonine synthase [Pirellulaceae bacterium]